MSDPSGGYTEVTRQSWFSRIGGSVRGILLGVVLIFGAAWLLFWNEGRAVRRARALEEGADAVVSVAADRVEAAHEGDLVHITGLATTDEMLRDETFGVEVNAIRLDREVEMYQWRELSDSETEKQLGGGTETTTTYTYRRDWSSRAIDSSGFEQPDGHGNPGSLPYEDRSVTAGEVRVGAFELSDGLIGSIGGEAPLTLESVRDLPGQLRWRARIDAGGLYIGRDPSAPQVGDVRVRFEVVRPATVSVVARQVGDRLESYSTSGGSLSLLSMGAVDAATMFEGAQSANRFATWAFRFLGYFLMVFGVKRLFRPFSVMADVLPPVGNVVESISGFFAYLIAFAMAASTIAVAWLYYRPLLGVTLLALAVAAMVAVVVGLRKAATKEGPAAPAPA